MDTSRIDLIVQYALVCAGGEEAERDRELGPIHLIKYVYLGDLAHALSHDGQTFTGSPWRFYHFGPWAQEVNARVEPAAEAARAESRSFRGARYEGEITRYRLEDPGVGDRLSRALPPEVAAAVRRAVHEFTNDTPGLLSHVYLTGPMLGAAPGEFLVFEGAEPAPPSTVEDAPHASQPTLSWSQRRERAAGLAALRRRVRERLSERATGRPHPVTPAPRYDEVFLDGVRWLDALAGPPVGEAVAEVVFTDDIWRSTTRAGRDVP